jgi:DNA-binding beta-propeller fold protein YncE
LTENTTTGKLYVAAAASNGTAVSVVPRATNKVADTVTIPGSNAPGAFGIAADSTTDSIYVDSASSVAGCPGFVADLDGATNRVVADVYGIANPGAVAVNTTTDTVYVSNGDDVAVFHGGYANKQASCGSAGLRIGT